MRLLITGALGHIGSRFIHGIRPGEYTEVVLVDNLATQRYCSLFNRPAGVPFRFVNADVCTADLGPLMAGVDVVIHLAALTNAAGSFEIQDQVERVNYTGTERVARACMLAGAKLIFISSTSVYNVQAEAVDEECVLDDAKPQSPYADSKLRCERMLAELGKSEGLQFVSCRFGTIYGASVGMRFHTAVNKFVWQACIGEPLSVWRTALHQRRPYLELGDAVRALGFILKTHRFDNRSYNIISQNFTVAEVLDELREFVPDLKVGLVDSLAMNDLSYTVRNDRFRALGFEFHGALPAALSEMVVLLRADKR